MRLPAISTENAGTCFCRYFIYLQLAKSRRGLRGGFAVWSYRAGYPIQDIMWSLRLRSQITLESYLQEAAALNCFSTLPAEVRGSVIAASKFFSFLPAATF